ncbi:MAG: SAM-dependent chlorinase/fluorinase [Desulfobacterales bacterium]|nr:SAM-dependent chlorinase/fluorinase [Desulfobacterales bacterium]MBF0397738.1 SAM-dependent chlorinase/fluorinase [Desulfobacterales bacterium]
MIALYTDFGLKDEYVGLMKGVILSINPKAQIVDITHYIYPQDVVLGAYILKSSYKYCPKGTIHLAVVDPGVGSNRAIIAFEMNGHKFLAPDNGICTLLAMEHKFDSIVKVQNSKFFLDSISTTFHGRDIFAPVAAHMSKGLKIKELGHEIDKKDITLLSIPYPTISKEGILYGNIISIDHFGNLITNIDSYTLGNFCGSYAKNIEINLSEIKILGLSKNYQTVKKGFPLAIINSQGYLEIALYCGNAQEYFNVKKDDILKVYTYEMDTFTS